MKLFALLAIVGMAAGAHLGAPGSVKWTPGREYVFDYQGRLLTGIPELDTTHFSGLGIKCQLHLHVENNERLSIQIRDAQYAKVTDKQDPNGGDQESENWRFLTMPQYQPFPGTIMEDLSQPAVFEVAPLNGEIRAVTISGDESTWSINFKKALVNLFQTRNMEHSGGLNPSGKTDGVPKNWMVYEDGIDGHCETHYEMAELPISEVGEEKLLPKPHYCPQQTLNSLKSNVYYVTKTRNLENCVRRASYSFYKPGSFSCKGGNCGGQWARSSITRYVVCGNPDNYIIQSIVNEGELHQDLLGYQSEKVLTGTRQVLRLKNVNDNSSPKQPSNPTMLSNAMYQLPSTMDVSHNTRRANGNNDIDKNKLKENVRELLKEITHRDFQTAGNLPEKDISMKILIAAKVMRVFNVEELVEIYKSVIGENRSSRDSFIEQAKNVVVDTMIMSGSSDSVRLFKTLVERNDLSNTQTSAIFAAIPRSVATPSEELLEEVFDLVKSQKVRDHHRTYHTALLSLSNLMQKACLSSNSQTSYPTSLYGKFCNSESSIINERWIPYLQRELEQTQSPELKNVVLVALGLLSHEQIVPVILPILEEPYDYEQPDNAVSHMTRYIAVFSLINAGKYHPERVLPVLTAIYSNKAERTEIRIAAFNSILTMRPDMATLQKIATLTWSEDDLEVLKVVNTAFYSLSQQVSMQQYEPSSSLLVRQARLLYPLIKKEGGAFPSSAFIYTNSFFRKMSAGYERVTNWIGSRGSLLPSSIYNKFIYFFDEYKFSPLEVGVHLCGLETVTQEIIDVITGKDKSEEAIKSQLNPEWREAIDKLRIKSREGGNFEGSAYINMLETSSLFYNFKSAGSHAVREEVRRLMKNPSAIKEYLDSQGNLNFQRMLNLAPIEFVLPSDMGLPIAVEYHTPAIIAVTGRYNSQVLKQGGSLSSFDAKMHAFLDARVSGWVGTFSPVDSEYIITGIDQHLAVELPFEMEVNADINQGKVAFNLKSKSSGEAPTPQGPFELLYYRVLPFTVAQNLYDLKPVFKNDNIRKISSGSQPKSEDIKFGEYLGLNLELKSKAETSHLGIRLIMEKLYSFNWNPLNFIRFFWTNGAVTATGRPSIRQLETKLILDPSASSTKELDVVLKFGYGSKVKGESIKYHALQFNEASGESPLKLVTKPIGELPAQSRRQEKIKDILEKINVDSDGNAAVLSVTAALKGSQRPKVYSYSLTAGNGVAGLVQKWNMKVRNDANSNAYCMEGEVVIPDLPQWSISKIRSQSPSFRFKNLISAGNDCAESKMLIQGNARTSQSQKEWSERSPEAKEYARLSSRGAPALKLSELAAKVRRQASALDIVDYEIDYINIPNYVMYLPKRVMEAVKVYWFPYYNSSIPELSMSLSENGETLKSTVQTRIHSDIQAFDVLIKNTGNSESKYYYTDIPLTFPWNYIYPVSYVQSPLDKWSKAATGSPLYPTCALVGKTVVTFDNKTIKAGVDQCMHLLSGDCSRNKEYGVFVRSLDSSNYGDSKKEIKLFVRQAEIKLKGEERDNIAVKVDGRPISISGPEEKPIRNKKNEVVGVIYKSSDDVVIVNTPMVTVLFDGKDIILKGSMLYKNKLCGLCGDNNNQKIADLTSPNMCLLSKPEVMVASYRVPLGSQSCKPLPQDIAELLEKETQSQCVKASHRSTKVVSAYKSSVGSGECTHHAHELIEKSHELCFSKIPLVGCGPLCRPGGTADKRVAYTCMKKTRYAERIAEKVRRGEVVSSLKSLPTTFVLERKLPITCEPVFRSGRQQY